MNILVIEDMAGFAQPIQARLEAMGHAVTWIIGAHRLLKNQVIGILASPDAKPMEDSWNGDASRLVTIDLRQYQMALVDGGLIGTINNGWEIVPTLAAAGICCVAISGAGASNPLLRKAGAALGVPKEFVIAALRDGVLDPEQAVKNPRWLNKRLESFTDDMRARLSQSRARKEKLDLGFPILDRLEESA